MKNRPIVAAWISEDKITNLYALIISFSISVIAFKNLMIAMRGYEAGNTTFVLSPVMSDIAGYVFKVYGGCCFAMALILTFISVLGLGSRVDVKRTGMIMALGVISCGFGLLLWR